MEPALAGLGTRLGYTVSTSGKIAHFGRTFKLRYGYRYQGDLIKVDLIYLNRAPLLDYEQVTCGMCSPEDSVLTLALPELIAGKTKALFDRLAVRDLYDVYRIQTGEPPMSLAADNDELYRLQRRCPNPLRVALDAVSVGGAPGRGEVHLTRKRGRRRTLSRPQRA